MSLQSDLIAAKALIDTPEKWMKGDWCEGNKRCAAGAARKAIGYGVQGFWSTAIAMALDRQSPDGNVVTYNDAPETTHADVMALFDRAIAAAA